MTGPKQRGRPQPARSPVPYADPMDRPPTIKDVALLAKVHAATASRALNPATKDMVSARTANRIIEAANTLGYSPNSAARSLRTRTSSVAGVIIPDLRNPMFPPIVRGIEDGLRSAGYMALLGNTDGNPDRERELLAAMRGRQTDGFILATSRRDSVPTEIEGLRAAPTVLVNRRTDAGDVPSVTADNSSGVFAVVRLLAELGHRNIAHLAGPKELSTGWERYRAFLDAMAFHDFPSAPATSSSVTRSPRTRGTARRPNCWRSKVPSPPSSRAMTSSRSVVTRPSPSEVYAVLTTSR